MNYGRYFITLVVVALIITGSTFAWKTITRQPLPEASPILVESATPTTILEATESTQLEGQSFILENPSVTQVEAVAQVLVRFTPELTFNNTDKLSITKRIIEPYKLYQEELDGTQKLLSIDISENTQQTAKDYPYLFSANFDGGVNESFVISRQGESVSWFVPECMGACPFGEKFTAQYPEIVKLSKGE